MHHHFSDVAPTLLAAGVRRGSTAPVWVEAPSAEEVHKLEASSGCVAGTCALSPALLELALIKWSAKHGEPAPAPWVETQGGFKVPIPVLRRFEGGTLRLFDAAGSVVALRSANPVNGGGTVPALVLMS